MSRLKISQLLAYFAITFPSKDMSTYRAAIDAIEHFIGSIDRTNSYRLDYMITEIFRREYDQTTWEWEPQPKSAGCSASFPMPRRPRRYP
jgi:hypothetical protein